MHFYLVLPIFEYLIFDRKRLIDWVPNDKAVIMAVIKIITDCN